MIGKTLTHYAIIEKIGAGGMGEIYRAFDTQLQRPVAIKLLGGALADDPEARDKLLQEARAASAVNHPNICTIYEVGEAEGQYFIAMEYVPGSALSQMIPRGGLPTEQVLRYGIQIADALDHAHRAGIVHRDLKSANVVVTPEGRAKVLDFGLARQLPHRKLRDMSQSQTEIADDSRLMGTLHYLAPELLGGAPATHRSDLWALGVVLYEIATRARPFEGQTAYDITTAILREPPAPLPSRVSPALQSVILHCLSKEPGQRYRRAGELRAALEALLSDTGIPGIAPARRRRVRAGWAVWLAAAVMAMIVVVGVHLLRRSAGPSGVETPLARGRLELLLSPAETIWAPALSPDGTMVAYVSAVDGQRDLFVRRVRGGNPVRLTNDEATEDSPAYSPDGEWLAFHRQWPGQRVPDICTVPVLGGEVTPVVTAAHDPAWSADGQLLAFIQASEDGARSLSIQRLDGSERHDVLTANAEHPFLFDPTWSPDQRRLAVVRSRGGIAQQVWIVPLDGSPPWPLLEDREGVFSSAPVFTPDGSGVVHTSNRSGANNLWLQRLDGTPPIQLTTGPGPDSSPSVAGSGAIAFLNSRHRHLLGVVDLQSHVQRVLWTHAHFLWAPKFSPDGRDIAFSQGEVNGSWGVWIVPFAGGNPRRLSGGEIPQLWSPFTPDGNWVSYFTWSNGPDQIWKVPRQGGPPSAVLSPSAGDGSYQDFAPDGRMVYVHAQADHAVLMLLSSEDGTTSVLTEGEVPAWSPDGSWIAFAPDRSYGRGIFLIRPDGTDRRRLTEVGGWPVWWPDGSRIGYLVAGARGDQEIWTVGLDGEGPSQLDAVQFEGGNLPFDISPDGHWMAYSNSARVSNEVWLLHATD